MMRLLYHVDFKSPVGLKMSTTMTAAYGKMMPNCGQIEDAERLRQTENKRTEKGAPYIAEPSHDDD